MARTVKWIFAGLIILIFFMGSMYAYNRFYYFFHPADSSGRSTELGERVDTDITGIQDGIAISEGRAERIESGIDRAAERAERLAEQRREMEARRKRIEERVAGIKAGSDKIEAGLELGEKALQRLRDIIRRLQEGDGEEPAVVEVMQ